MWRRSSSRRATPCSRPGSRRRSCIKRRPTQQATGQPEASAEPYRDQLIAIGARFGVDMPLDKPEADIMLCVPRTDIEHYPSAVAALARVVQHLGISCTFRSDGLVAENYGYYAGGKAWQRDISLRLIEQAIACKAKILLIPECGHAYTALRWEAADLYGKQLPFEVRHVTEFLADELRAGPSEAWACRRRQNNVSRSLPTGAQGRRQRCAARTHAGHGRRSARIGSQRRFQLLLRRRRRVVDIERAAPLRYPHHGGQAAGDRRYQAPKPS